MEEESLFIFVRFEYMPYIFFNKDESFLHIVFSFVATLISRKLLSSNKEVLFPANISIDSLSPVFDSLRRGIMRLKVVLVVCSLINLFVLISAYAIDVFTVCDFFHCEPQCA